MPQVEEQKKTLSKQVIIKREEELKVKTKE